jgi:hypothetical protein
MIPDRALIKQQRLAGGDPRPDKMGPTLNTDYAPLEDTFDALGPCQKCNNPLTRDAEGVYCPSCGYRSNPQAENARIDMYAPLGEGIGEGPFGLMSKTAINWPWQKPKSPGDWMQWVGDPEKNPFDQKNVPEGWSVPKWMTGEETLEQGIQRGMQKGLDIQRLLESPNPVEYAQGAALHTKMLGYHYPEDEEDQFYSTIQTLMYKFGLEEKDAWHFLSQAWTEQGLSMPSGRDSFSKWTADVWWLPNKTAADVQELAAKASDKIWQRPDLAKYLNALNEVIDILSESGMAVDLSDFYEEDNTAFDMLVRSYDQSKQAGEEWNADHMADIMKQNYGYGEQYIMDSINATPKIAPLWQDFKLGRFYHELISTMAGRYPAGYKLIPWAVNQLKKQLKDHYDINRNDVNHLADIAGQFGELTTELRRQNRLPQGFDVNGVDMAGAEDWMREYHAQHVGEGWDERNVWATLPNGWTVEEVKTKNDLQREGELMGHCVGGYCRNVEKGTSLIFSLRDPNGGPHVTFEYKPIYDMTDDYGGPYQHAPNPAKITRLELVQVQGKSDSKPKPEYQQMVAEFNKYLQGEGYQVVWADNAWRHDYGMTDQQRQKLRHENTYDLRGIEGLHQLEHDYDRNKGTEFFTKQLPDMADEYGVLSPSGVPEQWLQHPQLQSATDDVLFEIFDGKIKPDQYEEYGRKLIVAWYSLLSQPYASQGRAVGPYSPKSPVDARTWLVQYIGTYGAKLVQAYNESMKGVPGGQWQSQPVIDGMTNLTGFQRTIGDRTGTQMLDWTRPAGIDPDEQVPGTMHYWQNYELHRDQGATMGDYIPYDPIHNPEGTDTRMDEPGFHPEAAAPPEYVPYKFTVGKDGRIYGGQAYEHRPLIEGYGLDRDPGWTEVARGEYNPDGGMTLAEFANSPFGAENLASRVHQWAGTVNDPNIPTPNGDVRYNQWIQGQGWDKRQFRIGHVKWSMPMTIPQQQRAWEQTGANPKIVHEFSNGWTVRQAQTPEDVDAIGLLCRNCWQGYENPAWTLDPSSVYYQGEPQEYALFNSYGLPIIAFYIRGNIIEMASGPRNRSVAPDEVQMLDEFAEANGLRHRPGHIMRPEDTYLDVLRNRDFVDTEPLHEYLSSWKYAVAGIPANYTEQDPLDLQGKQPVFDNMQVDWWKLPPVQQRQAIVNAFRATMLSPRLNLKNNAIMYQEFMSIPADESDPDVFENHARDLKERWDRQGQGDLMNEVQPIGWEKVVPGKLIPGFWGNIRRLAALGPYADDLRQAALDDLNETGGKGTLFRNEVLKLGIPGVGPKVASFAWLALNPKGSDLATIDVWMMRHLNQEAESPNTPSHYFQLEDQLRDEKDAMYGPNTPLGQYQWGVWDKIRTPGFHQDHSPLKVHDPTPYTDVAWTQQYRAPRPQQLPEQAPGQEQLFANLKQ